jgi:hypothetical protein
MTAAIARSASAVLRWAVLLAGVLAIIAGIFGMHIMTGSHSMPMSAAGSTTTTPYPDPVRVDGLPGQTATPASVPVHSPAVSHRIGVSSCLDPSPCPEMSPMDQPCIPAPANTSLDAPLPGTTVFVFHNGSAAEQCAAAYGYLPVSRSPVELCISRT